MSKLPPPFTPADCDLRGFCWLPLDVSRLLDSDLWIISTGDEAKAAISLWAKAWWQVPAASLPDDDRILAHLSGAGARWATVREVALRGFVKCADGRLYHSVLAEKAIEAWGERVKSRERQKKWRATRNGDVTVSHALRDGNVTDRQDRDRDRDRTVEERRGEELPSSATPEPTPGIDSPGPRVSRGDRGSRLPADWHPSEADEEFARQLGIDPAREADSFRDYWTAKPGAAGRKSDWTATWRNWIRRSSERKPTHVASAHAKPRNGFLALAEARARADRDRAAGGTVIDLVADQVRRG